jgi:aspartate/methionine/tyrosine aminotransferase
MQGGLLNRNLDPVTNVQVTVGATEAIFAAMQALINPGDEVVIIEPFYDAYPADVIMAGGIPIYVPLEPTANGQWRLDLTTVRRACNNRTRLLLLNNPHNPTGTIFSKEEIDGLVAMAHHFDFTIVSDQVYEHIVFRANVPVATRPGAWERTLSISSLGKTFSVTGWKIGWAVGPDPLIQALRTAHQWIPFTVATPLQVAAAEILRYASKIDYFSELRSFYLKKRDRFIRGLHKTPFRPLVPDGSYFVMADISDLDYPNALRVCIEMPERIGVGAIPSSAFYSKAHQDLGSHFVRFAFCKNDTALDEATRRLQSFP